MNKDTVYIEPADDITDIIAKIKESKQKVVALVPPKKLGVLSSAINVKLIAKTAKTAKKAIVLVTDNPSLMKLCATAELPVAESLQSRPSIPTDEDIAAAAEAGEQPTIEETAEEAEAREAREELAEDFTAEPESVAEAFDREAEGYKTIKLDDKDSAEIEDELAEEAAKEISDEKLAKKSADKDVIKMNDEDTAEEEETPQKSSKKSREEKSKEEKSDKPASPFKKYRKWIIAGSITAVLVIAALVWAFAIAPATDIIVSIGTTQANFSENVSFTTNQAEEDAKAGKFYLESSEYKETLSADLKATEEKNVGEKAKGEVTVSYGFAISDFNNTSGKASITVAAGTTFTQGDKKYTTNKAITLAAELAKCQWTAGASPHCKASANVAVTAAEAGEKYNIAAGATWSAGSYTVTNSAAISGGSSKIVKVVQQKDIDEALTSLQTLTETQAKEILKESLEDGYIIIDASYKSTTSEPKPSVVIGSEAGDNAKVDLEITYSIYAVDSERIAEFIREKADLASDQKIYELGNPYIERFTMTDSSITGKLKTAYKAGPEITPEIILEKVRGRKNGEAHSILTSINGVKDVKIIPSFFWVNSIPDDPNKIHINIKVQQ